MSSQIEEYVPRTFSETNKFNKFLALPMNNAARDRREGEWPRRVSDWRTLMFLLFYVVGNSYNNLFHSFDFLYQIRNKFK